MNFSELKDQITEEIEEISEKVSIYIETEEGIIAIHENTKRRAASLIKVPILMEGYRQIENKEIHPDTLIYIDQNMRVGGCGVISYLSSGHVGSLQNMLELMIIVSDNTATNVLLDKLQIDRINKLARSIGCSETVIERMLMDKEAQAAGLDNYTSAKDMVYLLKTIFEDNDHYTENSRLHMLEILANQQFKHKLPLYAEEKDGIKFYHKTGELDGVEHDAAIMEAKGRILYAAVLSENLFPNARGQRHISSIGRLLVEYLKK
ncbi:serine hydrolase [Virgibacillus sp. YIM 98842]|uniref:serine hydrolase n=1 Tax=Virgibacillus sp. YIM 98842 TaxID=2663533 RepID=UPI0013DB6BA4|nr:serine hydrolase [Virgibacillus sp. YIM 98842]